MFTRQDDEKMAGEPEAARSARKIPGMYGYGIVAAALVMAEGLTGCGEAKEVRLPGRRAAIRL